MIPETFNLIISQLNYWEFRKLVAIAPNYINKFNSQFKRVPGITDRNENIVYHLAKKGDIYSLCKMGLRHDYLKMNIIEYCIAFKHYNITKFSDYLKIPENLFNLGFLLGLLRQKNIDKIGKYFKKLKDAYDLKLIGRALMSVADLKYYNYIISKMNIKNSGIPHGCRHFICSRITRSTDVSTIMFHQALYCNNYDMIDYFINQNSVVNLSSLYIACQSGDEKTINMVLACLNPDTYSIDFMIPGIAHSGNTELFIKYHKLEQHQKDVLSHNAIFNSTSLNYAIINGHIDIVKYLLLFESQIELYSEHICEKKQYDDITRLLENHGYSVINEYMKKTLRDITETYDEDSSVIDIKQMLLAEPVDKELEPFSDIITDIKFEEILYQEEYLAHKMRVSLRTNVKFWTKHVPGGGTGIRIVSLPKNADLLMGLWFPYEPKSIHINKYPIMFYAEYKFGGYFVELKDFIPIIKITGALVITFDYKEFSYDHVEDIMALCGKLSIENTRKIKKSGDLLLTINGRNYKIKNGNFSK